MMPFAWQADRTHKARPDGDRAQRAPRILIIESQNADGPWHYAFLLSKALAQAGFPTALATVFPHEDLGDPGGVRLCSIGTKAPTGCGALARARRVVSHLDKLNRLRCIIAEFRPDVAHLAFTPLGSLDFLYFGLLRRLKVRVVYTVHEPSPPDDPATWLDLARYRAADAIVVHSASGVQSLVSAGIDRAKITRISLGTFLQFCPDLDVSQNQAKLRLGLPAQARIVLFFGSIALYKGLDLLIEAFATLHAQRPDTYLVVAGQPLEDFTRYRDRIEALNLSDRVLLDLRYIPFDEFPNYFSAADVVAFPYRWVYQSAVLQFAYAYGRPVVVTNVGGLAEEVGDDRTGMIAAVDPQAIAAAVGQVLDDPEEATRMGDRGRRLARSKYSWEAVAKQIAEVYQSIQRGRLTRRKDAPRVQGDGPSDLA